MTLEESSGDPQTYAIIGAAMEVHRQLGHGFLEAVYLEALMLECAARGVPFEHGAKLHITYKGQQLGCNYQTDLICYGAVIVELKAVARLAPAHQAQLINYLKATGLGRGMLLNFGAPSLEHWRLIFTPARYAGPATL
jgi:GxxExxY protein